jgi:hypothetical protein
MASCRWRKRHQVGYVYNNWKTGDISFYNLTKCRCMPFLFISREIADDLLKESRARFPK